ncbi:MAG: STAS domain-containing protein [Alphaproteobacteria bacterium]|nr:STAS domain-containing protein [Alphaproteobacteria bacterium]
MEVKAEKKGNRTTYSIAGRVDTITAPDLEKAVSFEGASDIVFDLKDVEYLSSAGLRFFLGAQKTMNAQNGKMKLINIRPDVRRVFELVGFDALITME